MKVSLTVVRTENLEERVVAISAVFVESFVHDVPGVALACPVFGFFGYVVDKGRCEVFFGPGCRGNCKKSAGFFFWTRREAYPKARAESARLDCGNGGSACSSSLGRLLLSPLRS